MIGTAFEVYKQINPEVKDATWADAVITVMRRDWRSLVRPSRAEINKRYLLSQQPMNKIMDSFKDKEFKKTVAFNPLGIMENIKNTLVEEITKTPPKAELRATDPTALDEKKQDIELLKNRKIAEKDISKYRNQIGMPGFRIDYSEFKGNAEEFDKAGLDERDPDDVNFYERNMQRLNYEIAGQSAINNIMKLNRFDEERVEDFVIDTLAYKTICMQSYIDQVTGEIKQKYIYPEIAKGIFGDENDGRDDICRGWEDAITVMEWLQLVGNEFDWNRDWWQLLWAINYCNGYKYTGFIRNGVVYDCLNNAMLCGKLGLDGIESNCCEWTLAYTYKVFVGYIEWNTAEATATYLRKKGDANYGQKVPYSYELKTKKEVKEFYKENYYQQIWYKSYFISTTSVSQWIYNFGKVYCQQFHGANDEYASGTCIFYRKKGRSATEIAVPYIELANFAFYKMIWTVYKAKPQEDEYVIEELIQVAKGLQRLYPQMAGSNNAPSLDTILSQMLQYQRENTLRLRSYPQIDGRTVAQLPPLEGKRNGIDPIYVSMQAVVSWAEAQIAAKIGMNPMRFGANPPARESFQSENNTIASSYNSTGYVYRMIQYLKEHIATTTLNLTIDIIKFKDTNPYKWLQKIVGFEAFNSLSLLGDFAAHRYGIFIRDYNTEIEKQRINQAADLALQKGQIEFDQWFIITQTEDYKKANQVLAFLKLKQDKKMRQRQIEDMQMQDKMDKNKHDRELERIKVKGDLDIKRAQEEAKGYIEAAKLQADSRIEVKDMQIKSEPAKQAAKSENQKDVATTREDLKEQHPYPVAEAG